MAYLETLTSHNTQLQGLIDKANALPDAGSGGGSDEFCVICITRDEYYANNVSWIITYTSIEDGIITPHQVMMPRYTFDIYLHVTHTQSIITITKESDYLMLGAYGLHDGYFLYSEDMETGDFFVDDGLGGAGLELVGVVRDAPDRPIHSMTFWVNSDAAGRYINLDFS